MAMFGDSHSSSSTGRGFVLPHIPSIPLKLDRGNYSFWRALVLSAVRAHGLDDFLSPTATSPSPLLPSGSADDLTPNPEFVNWIRRDQYLLSWMLSSVGESMLGHVVRCRSSREIWTTLENNYQSQSKAQTMQYRVQLQTTVKGNLSVEDYFMRMRGIADKLSAIGKPIDDDELLMHLMAGFGPDYEAMVVNTINRPDSPTLQDVQLAFQAYEVRLSQQHTALVDHSAHVAYRGRGPGFTGGSGGYNGGAGGYSGGSSGYSGGSGRGVHNVGRSSGGGPGFGRGARPNFGRVLLCQLCGRTGHVALKCFKRFDVHFTGHDTSQPAAFYTNIIPPNAGSVESEGTFADADGSWCVDSGASTHITHDLSNLTASAPYTGSEGLMVGNGTLLPISSLGINSLPVPTSSSSSLLLNNILYVPHITKNLLSISQFTKDNNVIIEFNSDSCFVKDKNNHKILLKGCLSKGLYQLDLASLLPKSSSTSAGLVSDTSRTASSVSCTQHVFSSACNKPADSTHVVNVSSTHFAGLCKLQANTLHQMFGHPNDSVLSSLCSSLKIPFTSTSLSFCEACKLGKLHQRKHVSVPTNTSKPFQLIHSDLWGPSHISSRSGYRYYISFVDDFTRYSWIFPLTVKSETLGTVKHFIAMVKTSFSANICAFQSDWGGEFRSLLPYLQSLGIHFRHPCPYIHTQNGKVERKHQHIVDVGLTLLAQAHTPLEFWWDAFSTATYLINRLPTPVLHMKSPYQLLYNQCPEYAHLKPFGCACYPYLKSYSSHKLQFRSAKCLFLGYSENHKGYKCLNPSGRLYIADTVHFNVEEFPYPTLFSTTSLVSSPVDSSVLPTPFPTFPNGNTGSGSIIPASPSVSPASLPSSAGEASSSSSSESPLVPSLSPEVSSSPNTMSSASPSSDSDSPSPPPIPHNSHPMITRAKDGIFKPKSFLVRSVLPTEPLTVEEALSDPSWYKAMELEYKALLDNATWTLVPPTSDMKIISNKWVFRVKTLADGALDKLKARLVARGFEQFAGIDFNETFSPVVKSTTIRLVFSLAATRHWNIQQIDINNAFLNGALEDTIYMTQPRGFEDAKYPSHVCKLQKSLYGLKQAPRAWYNTLTASLLDLGFTRSTSDHSLFFRNVAGVLTVLLVYVDDILITGDSSAEVLKIIDLLGDKFKLKSMGSVEYFLGIEVLQSGESFVLHQRKYIRELLALTKMVDCHACNTPMVAYPKLSKLSGVPFEDPSLYRSVVGKLQYLTLTRPDIAYAVNKLSQFVKEPTSVHWASCRRVLKYLKGTLSLGLRFSPSSAFLLEGFCDADYAGCVDDSRSTGGHCVFLGGNLVVWCAKKQEVVSRSSAEAEYRSLAVLATEVVWLNSVCAELGIGIKPPHKLWCDNASAIALAQNPVFHSKTKHVEVDVHYIREKVSSKLVEVGFVPTVDQVADVFTKPLSEARFILLRDKLQLCSLEDDHG